MVKNCIRKVHNFYNYMTYIYMYTYTYMYKKTSILLNIRLCKHVDSISSYLEVCDQSSILYMYSVM